MTGEIGRRERKKQATRRALADAAKTLFAEKGFGATTVAQIAERADVSTRTFFLHFPTKESVLVDDGEARLRQGVAVLAAPEPGERPLDTLARALHRMIDGDPGQEQGDWLPFRVAGTTPELRAPALRHRLEVEERLAAALHARYPADVDIVLAAATVAAATAGAYAAALASAHLPVDRARAAMHRAVDTALAAYLREAG